MNLSAGVYVRGFPGLAEILKNTVDIWADLYYDYI